MIGNFGRIPRSRRVSLYQFLGGFGVSHSEDTSSGVLCEVLGEEVPVVFRMFLNTITKIFDLPTWFQTISSTTSDPGHAPRTVAALILVGSLLRRRSLEQLEGWIRRGRLRRLSVGRISADTIHRQLATIALVVWHDLRQRIGRQLARNRDWDRIETDYGWSPWMVWNSSCNIPLRVGIVCIALSTA